MDSSAASDELGDVWSNEFARAIDVGRRRALELLDEQQRRIDSLEANLAAEVEQLIADAEAAQSSEGQATQASEDRETRDRLAADFAVREASLVQRLSEIEAREAFMRDGERGQTRAEQAIAADQRELALARERLERDRDELAAQRAELTSQRAAARLQRHRIARKLKTEWSAQREALQRRKHELKQLSDDHHDQLQAALATTRAALEEECKQKAHFRRLLRQRMAETRDLRRAAKRLEADAVRRTSELCELRTVHDLLASESADRDVRAVDEHAALGHLRTEHDALTLDRSAVEHALVEREAARAVFEQKYDDLQRRFEMAVADLRQFKLRNAELETRLSSGEARPSDGSLNWETRKQHLLAALELDPVDDESREARVTIEGAMLLTDEVIAQKDQEIADLKAVLGQQASNLGSVAIGAAAIAEILDHDELVRQERNRLQQLQAECNDKLRSAEIEISLERARLARAWAELDDRLARARPAVEPSAEYPPGAAGGSKLNHGRWWAFLGLKDSASGG